MRVRRINPDQKTIINLPDIVDDMRGSKKERSLPQFFNGLPVLRLSYFKKIITIMKFKIFFMIV